jgi:hypothetical protein
MFGSRRMRIGAFVAGLVIAASGTLFATNRSYIGGAGTGNWFTSGNWSPSGQPGQGDNIFISPSDALSRTVLFTPAGPLLATYGETFINSNGTGTSHLLNPGFSFETVGLTVARNGIYSQEQASSSTYVTNTLLTQTGRISVANGSFNTVNFTQTGGTVEFGPYNVSGVYSMQGGVMNGAVTNHGTFDFVGGSSSSGSIVNHGTLIHRGPNGSLMARIENHGTIVLANQTQFRWLRNHTSMSIAGAQTLVVDDNLVGVTQAAGTFSMSGDSNTAARGASALARALRPSARAAGRTRCV